MIFALMYLWAKCLRAVYNILTEIKTKIDSSEIYVKTTEDVEETIRQEAYSIRREQYDDLSNRYVTLLKSHSDMIDMHDILIENRNDLIQYIRSIVGENNLPAFATQNLDMLKKYYTNDSVKEEK